ncbi:SPW repeat domain-containing protein [Natrialbaceae archaeon A-gly3]
MSDSNSHDDTTEQHTSGRETQADRKPDESTMVASEDRRRNMALVSGIAAIVGAWAALSVLIYDVGEATLWNNVLVGAVVFLAAGYNFYRMQNDIPLSLGVAGLVTLLGIWLIVAAALFGMTGGMFWSTIASGLLIAILAGYNTYEAREARQVAGEPEAGTP